MDKCCGNCKWFLSIDEGRGHCAWVDENLPEWVMIEHLPRYAPMYQDSGESCNVFRRK